MNVYNERFNKNRALEIRYRETSNTTNHKENLFDFVMSLVGDGECTYIYVCIYSEYIILLKKSFSIDL